MGITSRLQSAAGAGDTWWRMEITRLFLGWDEPFLELVSRYLLEHAAIDGAIDLRSHLVVLPGSRSGRKLLERLVIAAEKLDRPLFPPRIGTLQAIPPALGIAPDEAPSPTSRIVALASLLADPDNGLDLSALFPSRSTELEPLSAWCARAERLLAVRRELTSAGLTCERAVKTAETLAGFECEEERWAVLTELFGALDAEFPELAADARFLEELEEPHELDPNVRLVLAGLTDLPGLFRRLLADAEGAAVALVPAPRTESDAFDSLGCLVPEKWTKGRVLSVPPEQCSVRLGPREQAHRALELIADEGSALGLEDVSIGIADPELAPFVEEALSESGIRVRHADGIPVRSTEVAALLHGIRDLLHADSWKAFAALVRQPLYFRSLSSTGRISYSQSELIDLFDRYQLEHVPVRFRVPHPTAHPRERAVIDAVETTNDLLKEFFDGEHPLGAWPERIGAFLSRVLGDRELQRHRDRDLVATLEAIRDGLGAIADSPGSDAHTIDAGTALGLILRELDALVIPEAFDAGEVEMLGWLELPFDDAPHLIVCGCNEGSIPETLTADPFLPDRLRNALGLMCDVRRHARDAFVVEMLVHSRRRVHFTCGTKSARGEPLQPSRLLLASTLDELPRRLLDFLEHGSGFDPSDREMTSPPSPPMPGDEANNIRTVSVTSLATYLSCPYEFWLKHVLKLGTADDSFRELQPPQFGNLLHFVLSDFAGMPESGETNPERIERALHDRLEARARDLFGARPAPAVNVQLVQMRERLSSFAAWQGPWRAEGWRIEKFEAPLRGVFPIEGIADPMEVVGRIDRLDRNEHNGDWAVIDYKTVDRSDTLKNRHRKGEQWLDLQLIVYEVFLRSESCDGPMRLGYVNLGGEAGPLVPEWLDLDEGLIAEGRRALEETLAGIAAGRFLPREGMPEGAFGKALAYGRFAR